MKKINNVINVCLGNFFEMYDFMVFGLFASYIAKSFFPSYSLYLSLLLAFVTFGVGFLMRPLGAIVLGAYMDKHGRKKGLMLTLGLMAIGTLSIAITPSYNNIGIIAPIIILLGRLIQGFSAGAELGGVSVYLAEISSKQNRGFYVSFQSASQQLAIITSATFGFCLNEFLTKTYMETFGWRIPFIFGCLILPFLLIQRSKMDETPGFLMKKTHPTFKTIIKSSLEHLPLLVLCAFMVMFTTVSFYMITAYTPTFAKTELSLSQAKSFFLTFLIAMSNFILLPIMGALSDKIGRAKQLIIFSSICLLCAYPLMRYITDHPTFNIILGGELFLSLLYAGYNGAMVVALVEIVPSSIRTICFSLAYSLATALFGGFTPAIATQLIHMSNNKAMPAIWLTIAAFCSLTAIILLLTKNKFQKIIY